MTSLPSLGEFVRDGLYVQGKSLICHLSVFVVACREEVRMVAMDT